MARSRYRHGRRRARLEWARFRREADRVWERIPQRFREGAVLLVHEEAEPDPEYEGVFMLGACEPAFAALLDGFAAAGDLRSGDHQSLVHLFFGSFEQMVAQSPEFDWEGEVEETILHELMHHWEQRAGLDGLDRFDAAQIINFRRVRGDAVPFGFWRDGEPWGEGAWHIDGDVFMEVDGPPPWSVRAPDGGPLVRCSPDPEVGWATLPGRGAEFDGGRGDLVVAPRQVQRGLWAWFRGIFTGGERR